MPATKLSLSTLLAALLGLVTTLVAGLMLVTALQFIGLVDLRTAADVTALRSHGERLLAVQVGLLGLIVLVMVAGFLLVRRMALRPLARLSEATRKVASGDYTQRVELRAVAELEQLADDFNAMVAVIDSEAGRDGLPAWQRSWIASAFEHREQARLAAERAKRAQADFLANMSHEIRTPMNAVVGMTTLLADARLTVEQEQYVDVIRSSGEHLLAIVNDVLDYSKIEAAAIELEHIPFALYRAAEDTLALVAEAAARKGIELGYVEEGDLPDAIVGDLARLRQVLLNLLSNAVKFTEQGSVTLTVVPNGPEHVRFLVGDSGIGIPPEQVPLLFRRYVQADAATSRTHGGTGLGLVISQGLVELMGGRITVESEPDVGSTFSFTIAATPAELPPEEVGDPPSGALAGFSALVAAPHAPDRQLLERLLGRWGMKVAVCSNGAEVRATLAAGDRFDVCLVDQATDGRGARLARELADRAPGLSRVLISSSSGATDTDVFEGGLRKPLRRQALCRTLLRLLASDRLPRREQVGEANLSREYPLRILVAEDSSANQMVLRAVLGRLGYQPDIVADGSEAVEAVQRQTYDVVLMDGQMPRLDGIAATREIHARLPPHRRPAIIGISASADEQSLREAVEAGMVGRVPKPVAVERLAEALRAVRPLATDKDPATGTLRVGNGLDAEVLEDRVSGLGDEQPELVLETALAQGHETVLDAVDLAVLAEVTGGDGELAASIVADFIASAREDLQELSEALAAAELDGARRRAHRINGAARVVGAKAMVAVAQEIEDGAAAGRDVVQLVPLAARLHDALAACEAATTSMRRAGEAGPSRGGAG